MKSISSSAIARGFLALAFGLRLCAAGPQPLLPHDPATISSCIDWFDNAESDSCEYIRSLFKISPEDFHKWNPSIGLDCSPWHKMVSYCVFTKEKLASLSTTTQQPTSTTTTTSSSHVPSPTSWNELGCYTDDDPDYPVLENLVSEEGGDSSLKVSSCENLCWKASVNGTILYAGVKEGNQCWCGSFVGGQTSRNQTDCSLPCSGDKNEKCGGKDRVNVFEPVTNSGSDGPLTTATTTATTTASMATSTAKDGQGSVVDESTHDSGANRYRAIF